jgi:2-polyprenyl-3-methyl-5-hydroxy-6-metoxy-1,4-benzoquinol methylase
MSYERITEDPQFDGECRNSHEARYRIASGFVSEGDRVLDAGCGIGYGRKILGHINNENGSEVPTFNEYTGLDKNPLNEKDFKFYDFETGLGEQGVAYPTEWDVFVGLEIIEHLNDEGVNNFIKLANKAKKWIVVSTPIVVNSNPYHKQQFTEEKILELFKNEDWKHYETFYQGEERYGIFIFKRKQS